MVQVTSVYCRGYKRATASIFLRRRTVVRELPEAKQQHEPAVNSEVSKPKHKLYQYRTFTVDLHERLVRIPQ